MRSYILMSLFLICPLLSFTQNDSLSFSRDFAKWKNRFDSFELELKKINPTLEKLTSSFSANLEKDEKIKNLRDSIEILKDKIEKDDKKRDLNNQIIKLKEDTAIKNQLINSLESQKANLNQLLESARSNLTQSMTNSFNDGKNYALNEMATFYLNLGNDFDGLIKLSSDTSISRDLKLLSKYPPAIAILKDLEVYFKGQHILRQPYIKSQVDEALKNLQQIKRSSNLLNLLRINVSSYKEITKNLNQAINQISVIDKANLPNRGNAQLQKERYRTVIELLSNFVYENDEFVNYPFLHGVFFEIIFRKRDNADASIEDLLVKSVD